MVVVFLTFGKGLVEVETKYASYDLAHRFTPVTQQDILALSHVMRIV